jgi:hypothetical protein
MSFSEFSLVAEINKSNSVALVKKLVASGI